MDAFISSLAEYHVDSLLNAYKPRLQQNNTLYQAGPIAPEPQYQTTTYEHTTHNLNLHTGLHRYHPYSSLSLPQIRSRSLMPHPYCRSMIAERWYICVQ